MWYPRSGGSGVYVRMCARFDVWIILSLSSLPTVFPRGTSCMKTIFPGASVLYVSPFHWLLEHSFTVHGNHGIKTRPSTDGQPRYVLVVDPEIVFLTETAAVPKGSCPDSTRLRFYRILRIFFDYRIPLLGGRPNEWEGVQVVRER